MPGAGMPGGNDGTAGRDSGAAGDDGSGETGGSEDGDLKGRGAGAGTEVADAGTPGDASGAAGSEGTDGVDGDASGESGGAGASGGAGGEPGFEVSVGSSALPTMVDVTPVLSGGLPTPIPPSVPGMPGLPGVPGLPGIPGLPGSGDGSQAGSDNGAGNSRGSATLPGANGGWGDDNGLPGTVAGNTAGAGGYGGPLSREEQVAVLDAELEGSIGDFDSMILDEQNAQRDAAREAGPAGAVQTASASDTGDEGEFGRGMRGPSSIGGGMGGPTSGAGIPQNTAKYPPPGDIPNGNDDDVVARQLREAAMREPDPEVRERLWNEYRKYKGIEQQ